MIDWYINSVFKYAYLCLLILPFISFSLRKPLKIDSDILRTSKIVHNVGYAPNPGTRRRNQCMYKMDSEGPTSHYSNERQMTTVPDSPMGRGKYLQGAGVSTSNGQG